MNPTWVVGLFWAATAPCVPYLVEHSGRRGRMRRMIAQWHRTHPAVRPW